MDNSMPFVVESSGDIIQNSATPTHQSLKSLILSDGCLGYLLNLKISVIEVKIKEKDMLREF